MSLQHLHGDMMEQKPHRVYETSVKPNRTEPPTERTPQLGSTLLRSHLTRAIKVATLREFAANGYGGFSMESVAKRAGVGKAALYRRWPGKDAMIVEILTEAWFEFARADDTGSLRGDLISYVEHAISILRRPLAARIIPHVYAEINSKSSFGRLARSTIQPVKQDLASQIFIRAMSRREIDPDTDLELAIDALSGALYWRLLVTRGAVGPIFIERLADFIIAGVQSAAPNVCESAGHHKPAEKPSSTNTVEPCIGRASSLSR